MVDAKGPGGPFGSLLTTALAVFLGACALSPLRVDMAARAPTLSGYGQSAMAVATGSAAARELFDQGVAQAYAFNEVEAVRAFKAALAQDPACALCAWGVAWQLGPNINDTDRGDLTEALQYVDHALRQAGTGSPRDRGLIEALALRYGHASEARNTVVLKAPVCGTGGGTGGGDPADPLDIAYAERMRTLADRYPDDPDVLSLYAEAEMIATREDWWNAETGQPGGRIGELASRLEMALARHPEHVGLNHYMIHAVDALPVAARAAAAADRLGALAPSSPHLLHMPAHTYVQLGRYADASRVNQRALAADEALRTDLGRQGFSISKDWRGHDGRFLWYAAVMEGRGDLALEAARASAARAAGSDSEFGEYARSGPILTLVRLERWDEVLREPLPSGDKGLATVLGNLARGTALARTGQVTEAGAALIRVDAAAAPLLKSHASSGYVDKAMRGLTWVAQHQLRAEVEAAQGHDAVALTEQAEAWAQGQEVEAAEPPMLAAGTRLALGDMQLRAGHWGDAEQTFRADLAAHPQSGWAMRGLVRSLRGQGRAAEADAWQGTLVRYWPSADARLVAAR